MSRSFTKILFAFLLSTSALLTGSVSAEAQHLAYSIDLHDVTSTKQIPVVIHVTGLQDSTAIFELPIWSPVNYRVWQGGNYVRNFKAMDASGKSIDIDRIGLYQWRIDNSATIATISYQIDSRILTADREYRPCASIDSNSILFSGASVFGWFENHKSASASVNFLFADDWELATNLSQATDASKTTDENRYRQTIFTARDYTELAQAIVLASSDLTVDVFDLYGAHYAIAMAGGSEETLDSIVQSAKAIARTSQRFFSRAPFNSYMSFVTVEPDAGVARVLPLENASAYVIAQADWRLVRQSLLPAMSSALFAAWDGGEIHSFTMSPPGYRDTLSVPSIWFTTGTQQYYAAVMLARAGLMSSEDFNVIISRWLEQMTSSAPHDSATLESLAGKLGMLTPDERAYLMARASLTALALDLEIRSQTDDQSSLDRVMLVFDAKAHAGKCIIDKSLTDSLSVAAGIDLRVFRARYVAGMDQLPLDSYMELMGLLVQPNQKQPTVVTVAAREGVSMTQRLRRIAMLAPRTSASFR